jgi:hypothetical protein
LRFGDAADHAISVAVTPASIAVAGSATQTSPAAGFGTSEGNLRRGKRLRWIVKPAFISFGETGPLQDKAVVRR